MLSEQKLTAARTGFEAAQGRFGESVAALREMAAQIRSELDATRADLRDAGVI